MHFPDYRLQFRGAQRRVAGKSFSRYLGPCRCCMKNSSITLLALTSLVVRPVIHSARCWPPVCMASTFNRIEKLVRILPQQNSAQRVHELNRLRKARC
jgi:hypothetical protein